MYDLGPHWTPVSAGALTLGLSASKSVKSQWLLFIEVAG